MHVPFLVSALMLAAPSASDEDIPCDFGSWELPWDHAGPYPPTPPCANPARNFPNKFNAIHASLIPKGPNRGHVLVWDAVNYGCAHVGETRILRYAIVDPVTKTFQNRIICLPPDQGDLFCAGHAWLPDGDLLVVGGTEEHDDGTASCPGWGGAKLAYIYDPVADTWTSLPPMEVRRWYPSVVLLGDGPLGADQLLVLGGTHYGAR